MSVLHTLLAPPWLLIRPGEPSDADALITIEQSSSPHPWSMEVWHRELQAPHSRIVVAQKVGAELIGYCLYWIIEEEIEVQNIAVAPAYRGRGVGKVLLESVLQRTQAKAMLEVRKSNTVARALYEKCGFEVDAIRPRYYPDGEDAVLMSRR
jgi:ribosomal-protein-alanine N-acetyltransferase